MTQAGLVVAVAGGALVVWAMGTMGWRVSPFPTAPARARLVREGPFRVVRHPMYLGGVLVFAGLSLVFAAWALLPTAALAVFWLAKARVEERRLVDRFPEYSDYRRQTLL